MSNDDKDKKSGVSGVKRTRKSAAISQVDALEEVTKVKKAGGVSRSSRSGLDGNTTQKMSFADREKLLSMVGEEAKKLFGKSKLPADQQKVIEEAVKMAIDSALVPESEEEVEK
ncbi:hypothetical protein MRY87_03640 [bacterium]|nr:hypothetical protein [bacterium]